MCVRRSRVIVQLVNARRVESVFQRTLAGRVAPTRAVRSPDGREWSIRARLWRLPAPEHGGYVSRLREAPPFGTVVAAAVVLVRMTVVPVLQATVDGRPWIEAVSEGPPPVTMVWRATGRVKRAAAVDEIAEALARGESRPQPLSARWVGYERGGAGLLKM